MRSFVFASLAVVGTSSSSPNKELLFKDFIDKYDRHYATEFEKGKRFQIFSENVDKIFASNGQNRSYTLGITERADLTLDEFSSQYFSGYTPQLNLGATLGDRDVFKAPASFSEPDSIDWVKKGGVTSVKNQGTCGSCWTFSTVGALEGAMFVAGRPIEDLSMQHILACDKSMNGCGGGSMEQAFGWVAENGVPALKDEPYLCKDGSSSECKEMTCGAACTKQTGETCVFNKKCAKVPGSTCKKWGGLINRCECPADQCFSDGVCGAAKKPAAMVIAVGDVIKHTDVDQTENALEAAVAGQPVSVAIEADKEVFQHYTSGVLTDDACGSALDHGVLAVGYGVDNGVKYWKVKNSWGTVFGEDGFIRIAKGKAGDGGECGIRKGAVFPTIKKDTSISEVIV